ncbi:MAG: hypothetical protein HC890_15080 [Chloroflexaceae bacterium]|nr:hypothetical protein [Chloroflexaceae bacterium]
MKFTEKDSVKGLLKTFLSYKDLQGNTGFDYLQSKGYLYTDKFQEADVFIAINGKILPQFILERTILIVTEPYTRYARMYTKEYKGLFGGFLGISKVNASSEEFYLVPQNFASILEPNPAPEFTLAMIHQRYKKQYRDLMGDREREKAVAFFDRVLGDNFHTYARVWQKTLPWDNVGWKGTIKGSIMGTQKIEVIRNYRFLLCFENSRDDGYVTEKIFSALFAGVVPIYFGACDVSNYIPQDCFIEFDGQDYEFLYEKMIHMSPSEYEAMRERGRAFLTSKRSEAFTSPFLAKQLEIYFEQLKAVSTPLFSPQEVVRKLKFLLSKLPA